ncbi:MAG: alkene reductase [Burkholderiaceae bacterium]
MTSLFDPIKAGDIELANRIAMAPLTRNRSPGAIPTPMAIDYYSQRASAGLIVTEGTAISHQGQGYADVPGIWNAEQVAAWKKVTNAVHAKCGKIVTQLWHVGRVSHDSLQPGGQPPVAPSAIIAKTKTYLISNGVGSFAETSLPRALQISELAGIVEDYRRAARNAIDAGFDGVELHGANGYLLDQFLRSGTNHRSDRYGGSIENRARFLIEVMTAVANEIGGGRTGLRLSPVTPANGASDPNPQPLFDHVMRQLAPLKLAFIHIIEGATGGSRDYQQGDKAFDYSELRNTYRAAGGKALWMVNNGYDRALAEKAVNSGDDIVAFGKLFIANPDLPARLKQDGPYNEPDKTTFYGGGARGYTDYPALGG